MFSDFSTFRISESRTTRKNSAKTVQDWQFFIVNIWMNFPGVLARKLTNLVKKHIISLISENRTVNKYEELGKMQKPPIGERGGGCRYQHVMAQ